MKLHSSKRTASVNIMQAILPICLLFTFTIAHAALPVSVQIDKAKRQVLSALKANDCPSALKHMETLEGLTKDIKRQAYYEKPSEKKQRARRKSVKRIQQQMGIGPSRPSFGGGRGR